MAPPEPPGVEASALLLTSDATVTAPEY